MWEFGVIARNLLSGTGFQHTAITVNVPSAYMPPALPDLYYFFFSVFGDNSYGYIMILLFNVLISVLSIVIIYYVSLRIYNKNTALLTAVFTAFYPVYIYSSLIFSTVVYFHLFSSLCFFYFIQTEDNKNEKEALKYIVLFAVTLGLFIYFRAEVLLLSLIFSILYLFRKQYKYSLIILFIPMILISPWTIRNYIVFGKIIPVTTSAGYNFYTGHGDDESTVEFNKSVNSLNEDSSFEIRKSEISFDAGFNYIKKNPGEDIKESFSRVFDLWIVDRYRETSSNPLFLLAWLLTLFFFITGYYYTVKDKVSLYKLLYLKILIIFVTGLVIVFFNIPRYRIQVSFIMVPTAMYFISRLIGGKTKIE
jgi:4-amino-4-deoxy-L-arabinose transferase-like glycosyltransferase